MKFFRLSLCVAIASVLLGGCKKSKLTLPSANLATVPLLLGLSGTQGEVVIAEAELTRQGYDTVAVFLTAKGDSAFGTIREVASGTWTLIVEATDDSTNLIYTGQTNVEISTGESVSVSMVLETAAGNALSLDGRSGYFQAPNSSSISSIDSAITLEAWVKPFVQYYNTVISKGSSNYLLEFAEGLYPGIILDGANLDPAAAHYSGRLMVEQAVPADQWTHIAVTYSQSTGIKVYYGGQLVFRCPGTGTVMSGSLPLRIGARVDSSYTEYFDGEIDDVRIWNVVRSQADIADNMNRDLAGNESGLVAYYKFDEQIGSSKIYDASSNHNDGQLYGGANLVPSTAF